MLLQNFKDLSDMLGMVNVIFAVDEDIIDVHHYTDVKERSEDILDKSLKGGRSIGKTKWHDLVLVVSVSCVKGSFLDVILMNLNLVIART